MTIYTEDMDLLNVGQFAYSVTAYLTNYPSCKDLTGNCGVKQMAIIYLENPCNSPFELTVGLAMNTVTDGVNTATFTYPPSIVEPVVCIDYASYSCEFIAGPANYVGTANLCMFQQQTSSGFTQTSFNS
jgi:hypothetical protein